jgi:RNA polymerase sigma factor (sigma-70 family)
MTHVAAEHDDTRPTVPVQRSATDSLFGPVAPMRADHGKTEAFVVKYYGVLHRYCRSVLRASEDVDDVVQTVLIKVWQRQVRGETPEHPLSWAMKTARNLCRRPSANWRSSHPELWSPDLETVQSTEPAFPVGLERLETARRLTHVLRLLSLQQRQIVCAHVLDGRTLESIALRRGVRASSVRTQYSRALHRMRVALTRGSGVG